eukprot:1182009-Prorocentrum_minimum.AAC.7
MGGRGGMSEVLKDGLKTHWSAKGHMAGLKEDTVVFCVRFLDRTAFADDFKKLATPLTDPNAAPHLLQKRVIYPSVDHHLFPHLLKSVMQAPAADEDQLDQDLSEFDNIDEVDEADEAATTPTKVPSVRQPRKPSGLASQAGLDTDTFYGRIKPFCH